MAKRAKVRLAGRFSPGVRVSLFKADGAGQLRPSGEPLDTKRVGDDGTVEFRKLSLEVGGRYFLAGIQNGQPLEVRVTGTAIGEDDPGVLSQPPVGYDETRLADGRTVQEVTDGWEERSESRPSAVVAPAPKQEHARDMVQRSSTPLGYAHPVDPSETLPYPDQTEEEYSDGSTVQMSDTPLGQATPIARTFSQADVPSGAVQRSDTVAGVGQPIPSGTVVDEMLKRESSLNKSRRGQPVQVSAMPAEGVKRTSADGGDQEGTPPEEPAGAPTPEEESDGKPAVELEPGEAPLADVPENRDDEE